MIETTAGWRVDGKQEQASCVPNSDNKGLNIQMMMDRIEPGRNAIDILWTVENTESTQRDHAQRRGAESAA